MVCLVWVVEVRLVCVLSIECLCLFFYIVVILGVYLLVNVWYLLRLVSNLGCV